MKKIMIVLVFLLIAFYSKSQDVIKFNKYFLAKTLRFDYIHAGNSETDFVYFEQLKEEPFWGGSKTNLIDVFNYGQYRLKVCDSISGKLIYSRGYATLFHEWQTTAEAKKLNRSFYESVVMPYPKRTIMIEIEKRDKKNNFSDIFQLYVNPNNYFIKNEKLPNFKSMKIHGTGKPETSVDIVIVPEGYSFMDTEKLQKDAERLVSYFFKSSPFREYKEKFNFWLVEAISQEAGTDIPGANIWKNTILNSSFYTFDSERYLMTEDYKSVRDIAAIVPYDQIFILVNTSKYGGGAIYNYYSMCGADDPSTDFIAVHEFGHGFAALADEYYTSDVAYKDFYDLSVEPYQPNITTLVDFDKKWKTMVADSIPVPTPTNFKYRKSVGVFEGGGYLEKGIYRPAYDCTMKSAIVDGFCPVCKKSIIQMIEFYTK